MARRPRLRESRAVRHGTPPLIVAEMNPIDDHPGLGPLVRRSMKKAAGRSKSTVVRTKVDVEVKT